MNARHTCETSSQRNHRSTNPSRTSFDQRLERIFREASCQYELLQDGTFIVPISLPKGRRHTVIVHSSTVHLGTREMRHLFACASALTEPLPAELANRLLAENGQFHLWAWQIITVGESPMIMLSVCLPAQAAPQDLLGTIGTIGDLAHLADRLEEELTGEDLF